MNMFIKVVRDNYINFEGRARRKEFWMFTLVYTIIALVTMGIDSVLFPEAELVNLNLLYSLGLLPPSVAVGVRRLHDTNKSGWWLLLWLLVFIGWVWILILQCLDSDIGDNDYGPSDKYPDANESDDDFLLDEEE
ncbi:MAG: DUF805 domain-containing protein [Dehalococcoidia bacterium]|nr:DUF805 domain-containing protein [Dehalococcoidia bacterium]